MTILAKPAAIRVARHRPGADVTPSDEHVAEMRRLYKAEDYAPVIFYIEPHAPMT